MAENGTAFRRYLHRIRRKKHQIDQIFHFIDTFYTSDTFLLVDPVMGDDGTKYDMFTPKLLEKMNALVGEADIITPNLTEPAF